MNGAYPLFHSLYPASRHDHPLAADGGVVQFGEKTKK